MTTRSKNSPCQQPVSVRLFLSCSLQTSVSQLRDASNIFVLTSSSAAVPSQLPQFCSWLQKGRTRSSVNGSIVMHINMCVSVCVCVGVCETQTSFNFMHRLNTKSYTAVPQPRGGRTEQLSALTSAHQNHSRRFIIIHFIFKAVFYFGFSLQGCEGEP